MSLAVIDVGCASYPNEDSIPILTERFHPGRLYGFDPLADPAATKPTPELLIMVAAAWTYDGWVGFQKMGSRSHVSDRGRRVACVDLARFIRDLDSDQVILKIDAEGAEYTLLPYLHEQGLDLEAIVLAWVEWHPAHDPGRAREEIIRRYYRCPIEDWHH